jgi:predicted RNase H-like nuclease (RuvC/YqgF family)
MFYTDKLTSHGKRIRKDLLNKNLILDFEGKKDVAEAQYKYEEAKQNYKNLKALNDQILELKNQIMQLTDSNKKLSGDLEKAKEGLTFQNQIEKQENIDREIEDIFSLSGMEIEHNWYLKNIQILEYRSYIENFKKYFFLQVDSHPNY